MKRNDIEVRLAALGAAISLSALVFVAVAATFAGVDAPRRAPDRLPPIATGARATDAIPVAIVPARIEVTGTRSTETAQNEPAARVPRS